MQQNEPRMVRALGLRDLVLFNIAAVLSIRWLSTAARIGPGSLTLWVTAALLFFLPLAFVVARLTELYPEEGGIYAWTGRSFGPWHGFLCGWCYWLSNLFFLPNLLLSGVGIAFYTFGGRWAPMAEDPVVMSLVCLGMMWLAIGTNLVGLDIGKWTQNVGALATAGAALAIVTAGVYALATDGGVTPIRPWPEWNWNSFNYWSQIAFAFGGLELGAVMAGEIRDPRRTVPLASWISAGVGAGGYVLGTLAMLALVRPEQVNIVTGLGQAAEAAGARFGVKWLAGPLAGMVALSILGGFGAWLSGSARLAFAIGIDRYLPPAFGRLHPKWKTPHVALLSMGAACTVFLLVLEAGESVRAAYQLMVDMSVVTYFIPFLYLFATAWKHGQRLAAVCGTSVTLAGIVCSFVPPEDAKSVWLFEAKLVGGCGLLILAAWWVFRRAARG